MISLNKILSLFIHSFSQQWGKKNEILIKEIYFSHMQFHKVELIIQRKSIFRFILILL